MLYYTKITGDILMDSILITGASGRLGTSLARKAADAGYKKLILTCHTRKDKLQETADMITKTTGADCLISSGDLGDISYVRSIREEYGSVDVLINNAAISYTGLFIDMSPEEWADTISTNITSVFNTCHTFVPDMISKKQGKIINISSIWGLMGASCEVAYSASKGAVNSFSTALARELAPSNIQVNAVAPGIIDTEMNAHLSPEELEEIREDIPAGYIVSADEIADAVIKLLEMPPYFTGEIVKIDGGWK